MEAAAAPQPPRHPGQAVKELQTSTREAIVLLKAMIEEVRNSASQEETAINALFSGMQVGGPVGQRTPPCTHGCPPTPWHSAEVRRSHGTCGILAICRSSSPRERRRS